MENEETRIGFIQLFNSKNGPPRHKQGQLYLSHTEAEEAARDLKGPLKQAYLGVGKVRYKAQV